VLLLAAASHLSWWLILSTMSFNVRHMIMGAVYLVTGIAFALALPMRQYFRRAALLLALIVILPRVHDFEDLAKLPLKRDAQLHASLVVAERLAEYAKDPQVVLVGCGWWANRELEYLMRGALHFKDCQRLTALDYQERRVLLVRGHFWNWEDSSELAEFARLCERQVLVDVSPFVVSHCTVPPSRLQGIGMGLQRSAGIAASEILPPAR
jgi:hypothetical protein